MTRKKKEATDLAVIGWREWVRLPELGINRIKVKVDTGARSSALHAYDIEEFTKDGQKWVSFKVHPLQRSTKEVIVSKAKVLEYRNVRSSSGKASLRPVIETTVTLLGQSWTVELTLANRDEMGFRMLLGRQAIREQFLVDSGGSYYSIKPAKKKKLEKKPAAT